MREHEKNVIIDEIMEKIINVQKCVQNMIQLNQIVEMERWTIEKIVIHVQ
jgi:hypothetical protein